MEKNYKHIHYPTKLSPFRRMASEGIISEEEYYAASRLLCKGYDAEEITKELLEKEVKEFNEELKKNSKPKKAKTLKNIIIFSIIIVISLISISIINHIDNKDIPQSEASTVTVYVTRTGSKYHRGSCNYLSSSKIEINLEHAIKESYSPCSKCNPPIIKR